MNAFDHIALLFVCLFICCCCFFWGGHCLVCLTYCFVNKLYEIFYESCYMALRVLCNEANRRSHFEICRRSRPITTSNLASRHAVI